MNSGDQPCKFYDLYTCIFQTLTSHSQEEEQEEEQEED